jgi:hypothetical protein
MNIQNNDNFFVPDLFNISKRMCCFCRFSGGVLLRKRLMNMNIYNQFVYERIGIVISGTVLFSRDWNCQDFENTFVILLGISCLIINI